MTKTTKEIIEIFEFLHGSPIDDTSNDVWFSQSEVDELKKKIISLESDIKTAEMIIEDNKKDFEQLRQELKGRIRVDFFSIFFPNEKDNKEFFIEIEDLIDSVFAKYGVDDSNESHLNEGRSEGVNPSKPNNIHCNMCHSYGRDCSTPDDECCRLLEKHHIQE